MQEDFNPNKNKTFGEIAEEFVYYCRFGREKPVTEASLITFKSTIIQLNKLWGPMPVIDINQTRIFELKKYLMDKGCSSGYIQRYLSFVRSILRYCQDELSLNVFPPERIKLPPKEKKAAKFLDLDELKIFLDALETHTIQGVRLKALIIVLLSTGLRISEALSLNRDSIKGNNTAIVTGKGRKQREVIFTPWAVEWVNSYLALREDMHAALFVTHQDFDKPERWSADHVRRALRKVQEKTGLKHAAPHAFRKTFATWLMMNGANLMLIKDFLGHTDVKITQAYVGTNTQMLREAHAQFVNYGAIEMKPTVIVIKDRWSRKYDSCVECGTTEREHAAKGRCVNCYERRDYIKGVEKFKLIQIFS